MKRFGCLFLSLLLAGCAGSEPPPAAPVASATLTASATRPAVVVPPDRILVRFETLDCFCSLGDVERWLLEMEAVSALDWEASDNQVWLIFLDDRRPTDEQIRESVNATPVKIKEILRP